ncbi:hypothetical protein LC048_17415 [Mesobacillus subterraneus]|uniref:hypothetical protein n=1 Tax=Mesobacillus subterraneus TaxID=285983 RepID=UPI001CFC5F72|nr:hypothetical protein [Mesobacillus subterraneus]WLR54213.1 hypothetical protein LC048_17415 [Mesobacillus subterraneus]
MVFFVKSFYFAIKFENLLFFLSRDPLFLYCVSKRKRLGQPRHALEALTVKLFFDFIGRTEATRGARRWSWTLI